MPGNKKPHAAPVVSAPNVIPMADIMLVLLIIFMVITPMLQKGQQVDMAKVANPEDLPDADKDDAVIVAVTRDGGIFLGQNKSDLSTVAGQVSDLIAGRLDKTSSFAVTVAPSTATSSRWLTKSARPEWITSGCSPTRSRPPRPSRRPISRVPAVVAARPEQNVRTAPAWAHRGAD